MKTTTVTIESDGVSYREGDYYPPYEWRKIPVLLSTEKIKPHPGEVRSIDGSLYHLLHYRGSKKPAFLGGHIECAPFINYWIKIVIPKDESLNSLVKTQCDSIGTLQDGFLRLCLRLNEIEAKMAEKKPLK